MRKFMIIVGIVICSMGAIMAQKFDAGKNFKVENGMTLDSLKRSYESSISNVSCYNFLKDKKNKTTITIESFYSGKIKVTGTLKAGVSNKQKTVIIAAIRVT